jgi:hypothetical protein
MAAVLSKLVTVQQILLKQPEGRRPEVGTDSQSGSGHCLCDSDTKVDCDDVGRLLVTFD